MSQLLSARLQGGIRFLQYRLPADPSCDLAVALAPEGRVIGLCLFRSSNNEWVSPCLYTGRHFIRVAQFGMGQLDDITFWLKPNSALGSSYSDGA